RPRAQGRRDVAPRPRRRGRPRDRRGPARRADGRALPRRRAAARAAPARPEAARARHRGRGLMGFEAPELADPLALAGGAALAAGRAAPPPVGPLAARGPSAPARLGADAAPDVERLLCRLVPSTDRRPEAMLTDDRRVGALARVLARGGREELAQ